MNHKNTIKKAVARFLCWKLPEDFSPDGGISFDRSGHKYAPVGTNLLTAYQAEQMFSHCFPDNDTHGHLARLLVKHGIVEENAVTDPEAYDNGHTFAAIERICEEL